MADSRWPQAGNSCSI